MIDFVIRSTPDSPELRHIVRRVMNGEVALYSEALLNDANDSTPVVLLSEAEEPSSRWSGELLSALAERTGGSIWFDTRDIGRSSWIDEPYGLEELVVDVLMVLDEYNVESAHLLGRGMGGQVAQQLTLAMPERVTSLTLISSTPGRREEFGMPEEWLIDKMTERLFKGAPDDPAELAEWVVEQQEWFNGPVFPFDRDAALSRAAGEIEQGWWGPNGHGTAVVNARDVVDYLSSISIPALVVHGTSDPVYPVAHAQGLADRLVNSQLVLIEGMGHELPASFLHQLVSLIEEHVLGRSL